MQFKRSGEFTKKEREKFQRNVYLDESSAPMAASIKQKNKKGHFWRPCIAIHILDPLFRKNLNTKNESFTQVMQKNRIINDKKISESNTNQSSPNIKRPWRMKRFLSHNSLKKIDPIIISNPKGTHRRNDIHKKVLSIISRICRNTCMYVVYTCIVFDVQVFYSGPKAALSGQNTIKNCTRQQQVHL